MTNETTVNETTDSAHRALNFTGRIIDSLGPRPAGSEASRAAADAFEAEAAPFADRTWTEDFSVHPGSFLGWIRLMVIFYSLSVLCLWLDLFLVAALLTSLGLAIMIGQFFLYREVIDPFFRRRTGRNVLASIEPEQDARGQLIVSGHHDSAHVFNFLVHQPSLYPLRVFGGLGSFALLIIASWILTLWTVIAGEAPSWSAIITGLFTLLLVIVVQLWWFASAQSTPGAGDNLASSAAAWEVLRQVAGWKADDQGLQHVRLIAASWDAEEAGLRGARYYASQRGDGSLDLPTWNLNLECLYDSADLFLLTSDINGSVPLSSKLVSNCQRLMAEHGVEVPARPIEFLTGGTDAAELAKAGIEATTLMGMPWGNAERSTVYHTPADTLETVSPEAVADAIRLELELARDLDKAQT
jgi:aminopeptidase YwaD